MKKLLATAYATFFMLSALIAQTTSQLLTVSSPNGAPGIVLASLAEKNPEQYTYLAAETIAAEFANNKADIIIAPLNAGAKLYRMGKSTYKLAAVVTWGNLYIASQKKHFTLSDIRKTGITLFGEQTINASVTLFALTKNAYEPKNVHYLAGAANTQALLLSDKNAIVLTAEPALSVAKLKNKNITAYAVNDIYKKATGFNGYAQAGLFVNAETIARAPQAVADFLEQAKEAAQKCTTDVPAVAKAAVALSILPNVAVAEQAIPRCNIRYERAQDVRAQIEATARIDIAQFGGSIPADDFYYECKKE